jgi:hypothetical protein
MILVMTVLMILLALDFVVSLFGENPTLTQKLTVPVVRRAVSHFPPTET